MGMPGKAEVLAGPRHLEGWYQRGRAVLPVVDTDTLTHAHFVHRKTN
jgi:hypothetical protein